MKKFTRFLLIVIGIILLYNLIVLIIPAKKVMENNPFVTDNIMIAAHRGGADLNPDNTMKAFDDAVNNYHSDILELDVHMTKDNELVIIHDSYINDFCDVEEVLGTNERKYVKDFNYDELLMFNFGHDFKTLDGERPYRGMFDHLSGEERKKAIVDEGLSIVKLDDLFKHF